MSKIIEATSDNFESLIASDKPVVVDFWAEWCGPCQMMMPIVDEIAKEYEGKATICKVNVDDQAELSTKFGIRSIPTIMFFKNGEMKEKITGAANKKVLTERIDALS
ncbi:MAG: thioredoxin [Bernardetiaceae bacterium]|nr:thioredoxin [Bernardetiaceae bacterium]